MTRNPVGDNEAFSAVYWSAIVNAHDFDFVLSGCQPTVGTGSWDIDTSSGDVVAGGTPASPGSQTVTLNAADGTNPRVDLVTCNASGQMGKVTGSAAADPLAPDIPDSEVLICAVFVPAGATSLSSGNINDYRVFGRFEDYPITDADIASGAVGADEVATAAIGSSELATNSVGKVEIQADAVGHSELDFDPATQAELDTHEGKSGPHHARPSVTQQNAKDYTYAWETDQSKSVQAFGSASFTHRLRIAGDVPNVTGVYVTGSANTGSGSVDITTIEVQNNNTGNVLGTGEGEHLFSAQPIRIYVFHDSGGPSDGSFSITAQWKTATTTQHTHDI